MFIKKDKPMVDAIKLCWARAVEEHWYANLGKHEQWCQLREFENKCYEVLREIYSCPNISEMRSMSEDYSSQLRQVDITV